MLAEVVERSARVAREPVGDDISLGFHSLPLCFHIEPRRRQMDYESRQISSALIFPQIRAATPLGNVDDSKTTSSRFSVICVSVCINDIFITKEILKPKSQMLGSKSLQLAVT